jgi:hypothetical protein
MQPPVQESEGDRSAANIGREERRERIEIQT